MLIEIGGTYLLGKRPGRASDAVDLLVRIDRLHASPNRYACHVLSKLTPTRLKDRLLYAVIDVTYDILVDDTNNAHFLDTDA